MVRYIGRIVFWNVLSSILLWTLSLMLSTPMMESLHAQPRRAMTTVQYDNARTGWNQDEPTLNSDIVYPDNFGKKWSIQLDGNIYGAPLYVSRVMIGGRGHDVVYVATQNNLIYALDAENGAQLWPTPYRLGTPGSRSLVDCGNIGPNIGITSTPVIDLETETLYAVGLVQEGSMQLFKMAAVDIATGRPRPGWPVTIRPDANPTIDTRVTSNRGALLLANGMVYVPFGAYAGDCGPYHGWLVGVNKSNPTAPQLYYRTPGTGSHRGSGIWAAAGASADENGNIYVSTGNSFAAPSIDYSNAVLRFTSNLTFSGQPRDFFIPSNWRFLSEEDFDLGSATPIILPPQSRSATPNLIFIAGKNGIGHLLNRDNLGGVGVGDGSYGEGIFSFWIYDLVYSSGAYYEVPGLGPVIFVAGRGYQPVCEGDNGVTALLMGVEQGGSFYFPIWCTSEDVGVAMTPIVTSSPGQSGILWAVSTRGVLYAFDAASGDELYDSTVNPDDALGTTRGMGHFAVIDGKVFIPTVANQIVAYGVR